MSTFQYAGPSPLYRELDEIPIVQSAQFVRSDSTTVIRANYVVRDHERKTECMITKTYTVPKGSDPIVTSTTVPLALDIHGFAVSRSKQHQALLREYPDGIGHVKRAVEIWSDLRLVASLDVTNFHGQFIRQNVFQSVSFSPSETAIIYSAEANANVSDHTQENHYPQHRFKPDFGDSFSEVRRPALFMVRWRSPRDASSLTRVPEKDISFNMVSLPHSVSDHIVFGQAVFATEDRIFATGYEKSPDGRFLGIIWCQNRPSSIWEFNSTTKASMEGSTTDAVYTAVKVDVPGRSCRSPRVFFDRDGTANHLFWLSNPLGVIPPGSSSLHVRDLVGGTGDRVLVGSVPEAEKEEFPGLYTDFCLLPDPFVYNMTPSIVLQTCWGSSNTVVSVNIETGELMHERMWFGGSPLEGWTVLATDGSAQIVCSKSSLTSPPKLVLFSLNRGGEWVRTILDRSIISPQAEEALEDLSLSVIPIPDRYPVETIILRSKKASEAEGPKPYCVTFPHGGPFHISTTTFSPLATALALEGYTVSLPNYTGSTGFGDKYVHKLVGQVGTLDIEDCIASVEELINLGISERGRQLVTGGSHGGFITGHLIGQYPDVFKAAVLLNPVISLGEFPATSDIPDFAFVEMGLPYSATTTVTPEVYKTFYEASPIAHVDKVCTPALLIIGEKDLRVPPTQGKNYFYALKGRGRTVDILTFKGETHALGGVEASQVVYEATRDWFRTYTQG